MKIFSIAKYDFIKLLRDKTALILMAVLPVVITLVIGLAYGNLGGATEDPKIPVGITNYDNSELVKEFISDLKENKTISVLEMQEEELLEKVRNAGVEVGFIIAGDFGSKILAGEIPEIRVLKLPTSVDYRAIEEIFSNVLGKMRARDVIGHYVEEKLEGVSDTNKGLIISKVAKELEEEFEKPPVMTVNEVRVAGDTQSTDYNGKNYGAIGIAVMFVMFSSVLGAGEILEEKKNNTWGRLTATPTGKVTIMLGKILGTFLKGWAQIAFLMLFGQLVMGINWGSSFVASFIIFSVYLLCVTSLGMFLSSLVKTNAQLGAYSSIIIVATSMLSGCYWPIDIVPEFMQKVAMLFPQYWAVKGLNNTVNANMGLDSAVTHLTVLVLMGLLFLVLSVIGGRLKVEIKKRKLNSAYN